ncbi:MAG: FAD-dependent thymidylate synthase [Desulfarculaceae bacterium]|nr:FAD-dependent thymidylate synthase [Desulfarculaceae bacterium]MCF8073274.1 FAD-dependent thymidylate synthase [Desulfarculaceae bacterium]MCF8100870.1 FAD-dependent thymidylate synthase [Desulfarculaceae bacterium]MCF8116674.1 FAD-dependent thymidylate synthase [Desulfarculaceae bacterium]
MILVKPSVEILAAFGHEELPYTFGRPLRLIEAAGRTCYKSEDKAWAKCPECNGSGEVPTELYSAEEDRTDRLSCRVCDGGKCPTSAHKFVAMLEGKGHLAMIEHSWEVWRVPKERLSHLGEVDPDHPFIFQYSDLDNWLLVGNRRAFNEWCGRDAIKYVGARVHALEAIDIQTWPELAAFTAKIVCDRGVTHEIVRHRPASYAQESTRYCNYGGGVAFVIPPWVDVEEGEFGRLEMLNRAEATSDITPDWQWLASCRGAELAYIDLLKMGWSPQQARSVLPNSTKTEIIVTASLAEWQHIFKLRCDKAAHPQMREVMLPLRDMARELYPNVFVGQAA